MIKKLSWLLWEYLPLGVEFDGKLISMEIPRDYSDEKSNSKYSKTVEVNGPVNNKPFRDHVDKISDIFMKNKIYPFDIFSSGKNVIVQKISKSEWKPVLIDVKRFWYRQEPYQPNLLFDSQKKKKFYRRLVKFKEKFKVRD